MATVRDEVLQAFHRLEERTGRRTFRLKEVLDEVRNSTPSYGDVTIRTYVTSVMCADAPVHHANHTDDLRRVDRGIYMRLDSDDDEGGSIPPTAPSTDVATEPTLSDPLWYWEGHVQSALVTQLAAAGWSIEAVADTSSRAPGTDIIASSGDQRLHVEVKGYPTVTYARGEKQGQPKPTLPSTQARVWFAGALLKAAMLRNDHPGDQVAMGLPLFGTYQTLAQRVSLTLEAARIGLLWVHEDGRVPFDLVEPPTIE